MPPTVREAASHLVHAQTPPAHDCTGQDADQNWREAGGDQPAQIQRNPCDDCRDLIDLAAGGWSK
ncbi:MAG: hypothetical protein ACLPSW_02435 [Roseiarcus sp.]